MRNSVVVGLLCKPYTTQFQFKNWNWHDYFMEGSNFMNDLIYQALCGDEALCGMLGSICTADKKDAGLPAVYYGFSNTWEVYPCVSFFLTECSDVEFADDACIASKLVYQFDVFSDGDPDGITARLAALLRGTGFFRRSETEIPETNSRHKRLIYYTYKEEDII